MPRLWPPGYQLRILAAPVTMAGTARAVQGGTARTAEAGMASAPNPEKAVTGTATAEPIRTVTTAATGQKASAPMAVASIVASGVIPLWRMNSGRSPMLHTARAGQSPRRMPRVRNLSVITARTTLLPRPTATTVQVLTGMGRTAGAVGRTRNRLNPSRIVTVSLDSCAAVITTCVIALAPRAAVSGSSVC